VDHLDHRGEREGGTPSPTFTDTVNVDKSKINDIVLKVVDMVEFLMILLVLIFPHFCTDFSVHLC